MAIVKFVYPNLALYHTSVPSASCLLVTANMSSSRPPHFTFTFTSGSLPVPEPAMNLWGQTQAPQPLSPFFLLFGLLHANLNLKEPATNLREQHAPAFLQLSSILLQYKRRILIDFYITTFSSFPSPFFSRYPAMIQNERSHNPRYGLDQ
jgi:hypothetical protein